MNKFQIFIKTDPYAFLTKLHNMDKPAHGTVLVQTYPGAVIALSTELSKEDVEAMEEVEYAQVSTY